MQQVSGLLVSSLTPAEFSQFSSMINLNASIKLSGGGFVLKEVFSLTSEFWKNRYFFSWQYIDVHFFQTW